MMVWLTPLLSRKQVTCEAFAGQVTRKPPIEQDALFHRPCVCGLGQPASLGRANHDAGEVFALPQAIVSPRTYRRSRHGTCAPLQRANLNPHLLDFALQPDPPICFHIECLPQFFHLANHFCQLHFGLLRLLLGFGFGIGCAFFFSPAKQVWSNNPSKRQKLHYEHQILT